MAEIQYLSPDGALLPQAETQLRYLQDTLNRHPTIDDHQKARLERLETLPSQVLELLTIRTSSPGAEEEYEEEVGNILDGLNSGQLNLYEITQDGVTMGPLCKENDIPTQPATIIIEKSLMNPQKYTLNSNAAGY